MANNFNANSDKTLKIPLEELAWIEPGPRNRLFLDMLAQCKARYPSLKLIYGAMNFDASIMCDFLIVFEFISDSGKRGIYFIAPFIYTDLAIPGYRYAKRENCLDQWFSQFFNSLCKADYRIFFEYLAANKFGIFKGDANIWNDPKNFKPLAECLIEQQLLYKNKGANHV